MLPEDIALLKETLVDTGEDIVSKNESVKITQEGGDYAIQIAQARDVNIKQFTLSEAALRRLLAPKYTPPSPPDPDELPEPGRLPPGSRLLFPRNVLFTNREASLKSLARTLLHGRAEAALISQSIQGMGGIGKTQLAVEFAYRYGHCFHGVHWIDARQPDAISLEIASCGEKMNLDGWPLKQPEQLRRTLYEWGQNGRRLLILDNLEKVEVAREWLGRLGGGPLRVLLTARRDQWPRDLGLAPLRLQVFTPQESRQFLRLRLNEQRATDEMLDRLSERLGHLPLALELAGRYLEHRRLSIESYIGRLQNVLDDPAMLNWKQEWGSPTEHDLDLRATFTISWDEVKDETARHLFMLAGYCAPNQVIPCELLEKAAGLDEDACDEALNTLVELGLLQWGESVVGPLIHPLLAELSALLSQRDTSDAQAVAQDAGGDIVLALADALASLAYAANVSGFPQQFVPLRPHVEQVSESIRDIDREKTATLWSNLGYHLQAVADYEAARPYYEQALEIRRDVLGERHPDTATSLNNLGFLLQAMGEYEAARPYYEQALEIRRDVLGERHPDTATSLNNLGGLLDSMGEYEAARPYYEQALEIRRDVLGERHPDTATSLNNLGFLLRAMGEYEAARPYYEQALEISRDVLGERHPSTASSLNNLGFLLQAMGEYEAARPYYEQALEIRRDVLGERHPDTATSLNNLGFLLQAMGEYEAARPYYEQALEIKRDVLGERHPDTAISLNNLGGLLDSMGEYEAARPYYEQALEIRRDVLGERHPDTATSLNNLGFLLRAMGEYEAARPYYEQALEIRRDVLGERHPDTATSLNNLGFLLRAMGEYEAARPYYEQALEIKRDVLGERHPSTASSLNNLGFLLQAMGEYEAARPYYEQALEIRRDVLGERHPDTATSLNNLGGLLDSMGEYEAARPYYEQALEIFERALGAEHPNTQVVRGNLAYLVRQLSGSAPSVSLKKAGKRPKKGDSKW